MKKDAINLCSAVYAGVVTLNLLVAFPTWATSATIAPTKPTQTAQQTTQKIMVFGDSLSAGYGLQPNQGWVSLLETKLKSRNVEVVNASISGETTTGGASRIKTDLARHKPTMVILALGGNDGLRGLPVAEMRKNMISMLDAIRQTNAQAVIVGIQIPPNYGIDYTNQFKNMYSILARERKLPLVPFLLDGIAESLDNFQPDRIHPTAAAQPRILANVLPVVERAVPIKKQS